MKLIPILLILLIFPCVSPAAWESKGTLSIPAYNYCFLAATPSGDLLAATFNSTGSGAPPRPMPALLIRDPAGHPTVQELSRISFDPQRGYSGVASDAAGDYFVSADTGTAATCFVRKYHPDGSPDTAFANGGELRPGRRCLGVDVLGDYLLLAVDWGEIMILDAKLGKPVGGTPRGQQAFVRDIAIDPKTLDVFGVAQGGIVRWTNGTPWNANSYAISMLLPPTGDPRSGEGVSIDAVARKVLLTPIPGNTLLEIPLGGGEAERTIVASATATTHLCDTVLSFDGTKLFISDMNAQRIHVLSRAQPLQENESILGTGGSAPARPTTSSPAPKPNWIRSYTEALEIARRENKPMFLYFRRRGFDRCEQLEKSVLLTDTFNQHAQGYVCVFEDVADNQLIAYRLGVLRVPHISILDPQGQTRAGFTWNIDVNKLYSAMDSR